MPTEELETLGPRPRGYLAPPLAESAGWTALLDAPLASAACTRDRRMCFCNQAMLDLVRHPVEALLGTAWLEALFPEAAGLQSIDALLGDVLSSTVTTRHRIEVACGDGRRRTLDLTSTAIRLPDDEAGVMAIAVEASGAQAIGDGERGYRELVESAPDVLARFEPGSGRVLYVNRAIERMTGYAPEQFYADPSLFARVVAAEYRPIWESALAQVRKGDARSFDLGLVHPSGRLTIAQQTLYLVRGAAGEPRVIEGTARDITTVRHLERLKARNEERAASDRLKSQLLANVSHELRTPLVSIKGYNELLLRGALGPLTPRQRRGLEIAGANTDRLIELIETLLDFARREEGRLEVVHQRVDVRDAVQDAVAALHDRIASRQLRLDVDLGADALVVVGDRERLAQVFRALIGNAEKFSESGGSAIRVSARATPQAIEVAVADQGIGIPEEAQAHIFDRFFQVDASSTRRFGGAGLGLAMAKELVTLHGGEIAVVSAEGSGATFTVRLPRAEAIATRAAPLSGRLVVLVGADEASWLQLKPILESEALAPLDLFWAGNEAEVLRRARRHRPDAVVLALPRPEALIDELKREAETATMPVVVVSEDARRPIGRADLVAERRETARLLAGLRRLLGRVPPGPARAPRVVIVEDELEILDFTRFVLEREGYEVVSLSSGAEALRQVGGDADLVILDIALEESDGLEVCRQLKTAPATREVPILIMTAMSGEDVRQGSLGAGADGYLVKPFGVDEFLRQVRLHLRAPEPEAEAEVTGAAAGASARESA